MTQNPLAQFIESGEGTRLPPERQLAQDLGLSRSEIRKALTELELQGRITREIGRGTFVRVPPEIGTEKEPVNLHQTTSPREAMEARLVLEPELASLAAVNSTFKQIQNMRLLAQKMRESETWKVYEQHDSRLHRLIGEATGNKLLASVNDTIDVVRRAVLWKLLDTRPQGPPPGYTSFNEHDAIIDAIEQRDRAAAKEAMRRHLRTTADRLMGPKS